MKSYTLSPAALVMTSGSSGGCQPKYYDAPYWYKQNILGYEGKSEYLASLVLKCSNVPIDEYVEYEECIVNDKPGCKSKNFLGENEVFISFDRLYSLYENKNLYDDIRMINDIESRIKFVCDYVYDKTNIHVEDYLSKILSLDALLLNTDRHLNNLGIIINNTDDSRNRPAPIFDNGAALMSSMARFPYPSYEENIKEVYGQPFASNLALQSLYAKGNLKVDYNKLFALLEDVEDCRAKRYLIIQLKENEKTYNYNKNENFDFSNGDDEIEL